MSRCWKNLKSWGDIRLYDAVKERKEKTVPFDQYLQRRSKKKHA
ncbi:MAG: hypothetical protein WDO19_00715 [Bacteroidota bacterium]